MALLQRLRTALPNARLLNLASRAAFASDAGAGSTGEAAPTVPLPQQEAEQPAPEPSAGGANGAGVSRRTTPLPPRRSTRLADSIGVDLGLVGVEDKDARRLARMQRSRAQHDMAQRRNGLGPTGRLPSRGGELPRQFQPPGNSPPLRSYQPPRDFQPPRDPQYQRRRPRLSVRDYEGGLVGPRIGARVEPDMPRLASPRWSGQGRILGRPDIKPPGGEAPLRRDEPPPDEDEAPLSGSTRQQRSRGLAARSQASGAGSSPAPRGRAALVASEEDNGQEARQSRGRGRTGRAGGTTAQRPAVQAGGETRSTRRPPADLMRRGRRDEYAAEDEDFRPAIPSANEEPRTLRELEAQLHSVYGWDEETVRETDRELARLRAAEEDARAAAAADGEMEGEYENEADVGEPELVPVYDDHAVSDFTHAFHSELDPRMTLHIGLAPPKRGQQPSPAEFLDAMKEQLMEGMGLSEEEWEQHAADALDGFEDARAALVPPAVQDVEAELDALVHGQMPRDHPCYSHVASSLEMVKGNPFWTVPQKQAYLWRLVNDMRSAV